MGLGLFGELALMSLQLFRRGLLDRRGFFFLRPCVFGFGIGGR